MTKLFSFPWISLLFQVVIFCVSIRLILLNPIGYKSTDFEVHRNWMAITHSLPLSQWYLDSTSPWTLDYPPLFAWVEKCIAWFGQYVDKQMLSITNLNYDLPHVVTFQRLSVIALDICTLFPGSVFFLHSVLQYEKILTKQKQIMPSTQSVGKLLIILCLLGCNAGLLLVDHIHFQYNGFLIGILFVAVGGLIQNRPFLSVFAFSILLYLKHIFFYMTVPIGLFLIQDYCLCKQPTDYTAERFKTLTKEKPYNFTLLKYCNNYILQCIIKLIAVAIPFLLISFLALFPFIQTSQFKTLISRLFPFGRGLVHSYWAPNFWALYLFVDRVLNKCKVLLNFAHGNGNNVFSKSVSPTLGLIGISSTAVLPNITPTVALLCTVLLGYIPFILCTIGYVIPGMNRTSRRRLMPILLGTANYIGFLLSWHVHEKAILYTTLLFSLPTYVWGSRKLKKQLFLINLWAGFSLLPLLPNSTDAPLKVIIWGLFSFTEYLFCVKESEADSHSTLQSNFAANDKKKNTVSQSGTVHLFELFLMISLIIYETFASSINKTIFRAPDAYEFLPLLLISVSASIGIFFHITHFVIESFVLTYTLVHNGQEDTQQYKNN